MSEREQTQRSESPEIVISLPFEGRWLTQNSPARRVPSHGTDLLGARYAIDFVAHLRQDSVTVTAGDEVTLGQPIAECGNSGNSTQPHLHLQIMDSLDSSVARGIPMTFDNFEPGVVEQNGQPLCNQACPKRERLSSHCEWTTTSFRDATNL